MILPTMKHPRGFLYFLISAVVFSCLLPRQAHGAETLLDRYVGLAGSFTFVQRAPSSATPGKVRIALFEDFLCSHCYQVFHELVPALEKRFSPYLDIEYRPVAVVHASSEIPARAYIVSRTLGLGRQMQQALFHAQFEEGVDTGSRSGLAHVANSIGLDPEVLFRLLDSGEGKTELEEAAVLGDSYHVEGVPTMVIDGWVRVEDLSPQNIETILDGVIGIKIAQ